MKKLLSTIMALVMLLSLVPMAVATGGATPKWSEMETENSVAQVGNTYYEVLYDAVAAVEPGGTVTLLQDATGGGVGTYTTGGKDYSERDKIVAKSFTLDFAGHTYTVSEPAVGSKGYESQGFHLERGDGNVSVTLKNGTLASAGSAVKMLVQNYCNLTLENMTLEGTGIELSTGAYVLSNNCGNVTIKDTTIDARKGDVAFDVYGGFENYSDVTVTVTGNSVINGKVELARANTANQNKNKLVIDGGTINGQICNNDGTVVVNGGAFTDLASAVKYAADGATIKLAEDATGDIVIPAEKTITLDLGGHKLTNVSGNTITNEGTLTITGTGTVDNVTNGKAALVNYGTAILNGGNFTRSKENPENNKNNGGGNSYYTILNDKGATMTINEGVTVSNVGHFSSMIRNGGDDKTAAVSTMTIKGGTFSGGINTVKNDENGVLTISGGDFSNTSQVVIMNWNKATISGGTFEANASAEAVLFTAKYLENRAVGELKIEGGTYVCAKNQKLIVDRYNNDDQYLGTAVISAGAFNVAPDAKYLAEGMIVVPSTDGTFNVKPKTSQEGNTTTTTEVSKDGKTVTETETKKDGNVETVTKTETNLDTGKITEDKTVTKTETKKDGNVETKTTTVTKTKTEDGKVAEATETVTTEKTENGGTTTVVTEKDTLNKTETTEVTGVTAPTTASDVTLDVKNTTNVAVNKASLSELKKNTVKDVIIETDQAKLKLNKTAVKTMESNVPANGKMTLDVTVTENTAKEVTVTVEAKTQGDKNVFPPETKNTNGEIEITIPYTGTATQLDLWYTTDSGSIYMGRFPVVNGYVSFKVTHFSQYNLIPVASSGSSVIKTGAGSSAASTTQTVTTDLTPGSITKVTVDGKVVDAKYYTVSGSNVTFTAEFLKTLKNGSHTVTVENATKIAKGVFTVNNPTTAVQAPTTADAGIALYAGMAIASVMGTGVVFTSRKRKNH